MVDTGKIYHNLKSKAVNLKGAVDLLQKSPLEKRTKIITLMREAAQDIIRLLAELETQPKP